VKSAPKVSIAGRDLQAILHLMCFKTLFAVSSVCIIVFSFSAIVVLPPLFAANGFKNICLVVLGILVCSSFTGKAQRLVCWQQESSYSSQPHRVESEFMDVSAKRPNGSREDNKLEISLYRVSDLSTYSGICFGEIN